MTGVRCRHVGACGRETCRRKAESGDKLSQILYLEGFDECNQDVTPVIRQQQTSSFASLLHSRERVLGKRDKPYEAAVVRPDELRRFDLSL